MCIIKSHELKTEAVYSDDEKYRYSLIKTWYKDKPKATFIGINPSDATELFMDKTVMNLKRDTGTGQLSQSSDWFLGREIRSKRHRDRSIVPVF